MRKEFSAVVCLWEYQPPGSASRWKLVESYLMDDYGYAVTPVKLASTDRNSYACFLVSKVLGDVVLPPDSDIEDCDYVSVPGRAVTMWSMDAGVRLVGLNLPEDCHWISQLFIKELLESKDGITFLTDDWAIRKETVEVAQKAMQQYPKGYIDP